MQIATPRQTQVLLLALLKEAVYVCGEQEQVTGVCMQHTNL